MTFTLLRAGLPNTIVAAALAAMPILALATPHPTPRAPVEASVTVASQPGEHIIAD